MRFIGALPTGEAVYASEDMIAQKGLEETRMELVDTHWHRAGITPPGYHKVVTGLSGETVLIKAASHEAAVQAWTKSKEAR